MSPIARYLKRIPSPQKFWSASGSALRTWRNKLQVNLIANGATPSLAWYGGRGSVTVWGNFGGGTATLQMSPDVGTTWINVDETGDAFVTFTASGDGGFELGLCLLRVNLTGATAPSITVSI
jgi:hypothetical protein